MCRFSGHISGGHFLLPEHYFCLSCICFRSMTFIVIRYCMLSCCVVLYCIVSYCIVLYRIALCCIELYCIVLYRIVMYCIVLYRIVLHCIVCIAVYRIELHCIVLCLSWVPPRTYCNTWYAQFVTKSHHRLFDDIKNTI